MLAFTSLPDRPKVSVVVTAYKLAHFVRQAIDSVLAQDYPAELVQIIVVDDGSADGTAEILAGYGSAIHAVIHPENRGFNAAVTSGLALATGDLITLLDGDDEWRTDRLKVMVEAFAGRYDIGLVYGDMEIIDVEGALLARSFSTWTKCIPTEGDVFSRLISGNFISGGATMFRAELLALVSEIPEWAAYPDWYIATRIAQVSRVKYLDYPVNRYRLHESNMGLGATGEKFLAARERDLSFQRHILRNWDIGRASASDILGAATSVAHFAVKVASSRSCSVGEVLAITAQDCAHAADHLAAARELICQRDSRAVAELGVALGWNPLDGEASALLRFLADGGVENRGTPQPDVGGRLDWPRRINIVAFLDELVASPLLLKEWARVFAGADQVMLAVCVDARVDSALTERWNKLLHRAGLDLPDCASVTLVPVLAATAVGVRPDALYSERQRVSDVPVFGRFGISRLAKMTLLENRHEFAAS